MDQNKADIYGRITSQIIGAIEAGVGAYRMPWHVTDADTFAPRNAASGRPYRGVNALSLWSAAATRGYASGLWATYRQWRELGAQVRRGAKATPVVFWKITDKAGRRVEGADVRRMPARDRLLQARGYSVFNAAQVDGYTPRPRPAPDAGTRDAAAAAFFRRLGPNVQHGGSGARYLPGVDLILMPRFESFREPAAYFSALAHEATRWTGAPHRLNRELKSKYASEGYAMEELVAELGAAFLCASLRLSVTSRPEHAEHIAGWLEVLRRDRRAVFAAAYQAQRAADWMTERAGDRGLSGLVRASR